MTVATESPEVPAPASGRPAEPHRVGGGLLDPKILWKSTPDAFKKLDPRVQIKNPVMFVVEVGALLCMYTAIRTPSAFNWTIVVWLWLTVVFANLAEAVAEGRGKAKAESLRQTRANLVGVRVRDHGRRETVPATELRMGDVVRVEKNDVVPADGEVVEGVVVEEGSVLAMGTFISATTKIVDRDTGEVRTGRVPAYSVVVPGSLPGKPLPDGSPGPHLYCAVIVKKVDEQTRAKTSINDLLRE